MQVETGEGGLQKQVLARCRDERNATRRITYRRWKAGQMQERGEWEEWGNLSRGHCLGWRARPR